MENFKNSHNRIENTKGNMSFIKEIEDTTGFYEMKTEEGADVEKFSKKQQFVSLLASSLVPIAAIATKDGKYYSKLVDTHESHGEHAEKKTPLFALVQYVLFRDTDKPGFDRPNIMGGVSFDFDYARFDKEDLPPYAMRLPLTLEKLKSVPKEDISHMLESVKEFGQEIEGEIGEKRIAKMIEVSGYKIFPPKHIQEVLLARVEELKNILAERV